MNNIKFNKKFTALIGSGYCGTNIASNLNKICKNKIYLYDKNKKNMDILDKKFQINLSKLRIMISY